MQIHSLPLFDEDRTLVSLQETQSQHWFGRPLTHWQARTCRGNTLNLYFYNTCLDVEFVQRKTQSTIVYSFDGIEHALPVAEVLRLLGLCMAVQEVTA